MSIAVHVSADGVRLPLSRVRITEIARRVLTSEGVREAMVSITFLGTRTMAALNRKHLGHRGATDVISFAFSEPTRRGPVIADITSLPMLPARTRAATAQGFARSSHASWCTGSCMCSGMTMRTMNLV